MCKLNESWNGSSCDQPCPSDQFYNGVGCSSCQPHQMWYSGGLSCQSVCSPGHRYVMNLGCIYCTKNQFWNGFNCVCDLHQKYDPILGCTDQCPVGKYYDLISCKDCQPHQRFDNDTQSCINQCSQGQYYSSLGCIYCAQHNFFDGQKCLCARNQRYDFTNLACTDECPTDQIYTGSSCITCNQPHQYYSSDSQTCQDACSPGWFYSPNYGCMKCTDGQYWTGETCLCSQNQKWNGTSCVEQCPEGQIFHQNQCNSCLSNQNFDLSSMACQTQCSSNMIYSIYWGCYTGCSQFQYFDGNSCICLPNESWNGSSCSTSCPANQFISTSGCMSCQQHQMWNIQSQTCYDVCHIHQPYKENIGCMWCGPQNYPSINLCECKPNQSFSPLGCIDECPEGEYFDGNSCKICQPHQLFNSDYNKCLNQCSAGQFYSPISGCQSCGPF